MNRQRGHLGTKVTAGKITRLKILSMGDPGSGKSCLIKRYCEGRFVTDYVTTIGIDFGVKGVRYDADEIKVNFWDVGGDPIYFDIRNEFYKDTHGAMLVVDVSTRIGFDNIGKWMSEMHSYANTNVILFLVASKTDIQPRMVESLECEAMAREIGAKYFETSAATGDGVIEMFDSLFQSSKSIHFPLGQSLNSSNTSTSNIAIDILRGRSSFRRSVARSIRSKHNFKSITQTTALSKGDGQMMYMRWFSWDGDKYTTPRTYTAAYFVAVDDYSELTVPNSISLLVPAASTASAYRNISLFYYQTVNNSPHIVCNLTPRRMWVKTEFDWAVSARIVQTCDWAPTNCVANPNSYALDSICANACTGQTCRYNITLRVAWTGTDARGSTLTSYSRDIWRLQNSLQN
ncbi:hypothetical protein BASA81_015112 [Batrachochytrium salamandrivorans]|nr:hypothetical protein BASA81_015112 [Batrachochytrium salamandrivorans]